MANHSQGSNLMNREGGQVIAHTIPINFDTTGIANGVQIAYIKADTYAPVMIEVQAEVVTAFNAVSTNVLTVGTNATAYDNLLAAGSITEGTPGFYPASNAVAKVTLTADTAIYAKYTQSGTAATTGASRIIIKEIPINTALID